MRTITGAAPTTPGGYARCDEYTITTKEHGVIYFANEGGPAGSGLLPHAPRVAVKRDRLRVAVGLEVDALSFTIYNALTGGDSLAAQPLGHVNVRVQGYSLQLAALWGWLDDARVLLRHHWAALDGSSSGSVILWDGFIGRVFPTSKEVRIEAWSALDHLNTDMPKRLFKDTCGWQYASWQCGAARGSTPCTKTRSTCTTNNFSGFPFLPPASTTKGAPTDDKARKAQDAWYEKFWKAKDSGAKHGMRPAPARASLSVATSAFQKPVPILFGTYRVAGNVIFNPWESYCVTPVIDESEGTPPYKWASVYMSVAIALCDAAVQTIRYLTLPGFGGLPGVSIPIGVGAEGLGGDERISWCWRDKRWYPNLDYLRYQGGEFHVHTHNQSQTYYDTLQGPYETRPGGMEQEPYPWTAYNETTKTRTRAAYEAARTGSYVLPFECRYPGTFLVCNDMLLPVKCTKESDFNNTAWIMDQQMPEFAFCLSGLGVDTPGPGQDAEPDYIISTFLTQFCEWSGDLLDGSLISLYGEYCRHMNFKLSIYMDTQKPARQWLREILDMTGGECFWSANAEHGVLKFTTLQPYPTAPNSSPNLIEIPQAHMLPIGDGTLIEWERIAHSETFNCCPVDFPDWQLVNGPTGYDYRLPGAIIDVPAPEDWAGFGSASAYDQATQEWTDETDAQAIGSTLRKDTSFNAYGVTNKAHAITLSELITKKSLYLRTKSRVRLPWMYLAAEPMDYLLLRDDSSGWWGYVRIASVEEGEDGDSIIVEAVEWPFDFRIAPVVVPAAPGAALPASGLFDDSAGQLGGGPTSEVGGAIQDGAIVPASGNTPYVGGGGVPRPSDQQPQ